MDVSQINVQVVDAKLNDQSPGYRLYRRRFTGLLGFVRLHPYTNIFLIAS